MTQKELISETAKSLDMTKVQTEQLLNATSELIIQALLDGKSVMIQNFGTLEVKQKRARFRAPQDGCTYAYAPEIASQFQSQSELERGTEERINDGRRKDYNSRSTESDSQANRDRGSASKRIPQPTHCYYQRWTSER